MDGATMQIVDLTEGDASVMKECTFAHSATKGLENHEDEWEWRGSWLMRHKKKKAAQERISS
eukprot:5834567-Prorocentrum_lima.AAC.1